MDATQATLADVNGALDRARAFMQSRRVAVAGDGRIVSVVAAPPGAPAPPPPDTTYVEPAGTARLTSPSRWAARAPEPQPQPASVSTGSFGGGSLGRRSRQLRARRGLGDGPPASPEEPLGPAAFSGGPSSPPGELRSRAQQLRESKSVSGTPANMASSASWAEQSGAGGRPVSPWRMSTAGSPARGAISARFSDYGVAESQSVRERAYQLLQMKKGNVDATAESWRGVPPPPSATASMRSFSPARPQARSPSRRASLARSAASGATDLVAAANQLDAEEARHVAEEVRTLFARNNVDIIAAFESFDRDGNRTIDPTEFRTGLTDLNIGLSAAQIDGVRTISTSLSSHPQIVDSDLRGSRSCCGWWTATATA